MSIQNNNDMLVSEVMMPLERCPVIGERVILKEALEVMGQSRLGIACIIGEDNLLLGIMTDGDIRRKLLKVQKPFSAFFIDDALVHSIRTPTTIKPDVSLKEAVSLMGLKQVWDLPVVDKQNNLLGLLHLHPAIEALLGLRS
ncbi:CBS domain-containing protein [Oceanospirillaceae bacterium]|nr:CBS domain-containing protein [Oceanospirillaceae bacterium]